MWVELCELQQSGRFPSALGREKVGGGGGEGGRERKTVGGEGEEGQSTTLSPLKSSVATLTCTLLPLPSHPPRSLTSEGLNFHDLSRLEVIGHNLDLLCSEGHVERE